MQMTCPKCRGEMRNYERSGVTIDQCGECRGIFLDRGELEKLFEAEANWNRQHGAPAPGQPAGYAPPPPGGHGQPGYGQPSHVPPPPPAHYPPQPAYGGHGGHYGYHGHRRHKRHKGGFLGELFD
jgi:Zn-finger nucleic acid-binding protein